MPYVNSQGYRIYYEVVGTGHPLLLHHGFADGRKSWFEYGYVESFQSHYQLILIDALGHGDSDKPHFPAAYDLENRIADVIAVLDDLKLESVDYFGYSMGGWVGFKLAYTHPKRIKRMIIGGFQPYGHEFNVFRQILAEGLETWVIAIEQISGKLQPQTKKRFLDNDLDALLAIIAEDRPSFSEILPHLTLPCLLFAGTSDLIYPSVAKCATEMPNTQLVLLPKLNHFQAIVRSELILPHIHAFFGRLSYKDSNNS